MNRKILIFGRGYIGQRLHKELKAPLSNIHIRSYKDIEKEIQNKKPKIIINCIGHTGKRNVDDCELKFNKTISTNTFIPILFGEAAYREGIKLIHISSGCIYHFDYNKQKPILETRTPDYHNLFYSRTKIYAEEVLENLSQTQNILIARIRVPLDNRPYAKNILTKLIQYKSIIDVPNSVTYIPDFVKALKHLIRINAKGTYNIACKNSLYYSKLLDEYKKYRPQFEYSLIKVKKLKLNRTNLILSTKKLEKSGFKVRPTNEVVPECVKQYVKY